ncbi:MAG TPA: hypothetical protein ENG87_03805 [Candidatus Pacearchaeota archaeon]|nr:hypothetical protein [Candidatus Pacearchaeota archaeon]
MIFGDRYKKVLKKPSVYVDIINDMLAYKEQGSSLYLLENDIGLHKLLHHPNSIFRNNLKGINTKVFTWKKGKMIENNIKELLGIGAKVFLTEPIIQHYALFENPKKIIRILWAEKRHRDERSSAYDCHHTPEPYPKVWKELKEYFSDLESKTEKITLIAGMFFP